MKNNAKMIGMMIKKYRIEQNMSQEALCQGICAVSYLSKIEKGAVVCSDEILNKLFDVLGISVPDNPEALEIYEEKIEEYFRHFLCSNKQGCQTIITELLPQRDLLIHSYLSIDMILIEAYNQYDTYDGKNDLKSHIYNLFKYEDYMNDLQSHRMYMLLGSFELHVNGNYGAGLDYYKLARNRRSDGIVLESLSIGYYLTGDYFECISHGDEAFKKLMEEGYIDRAITISSVIAAAYANFRNIDKMLKYYYRVLALINNSSKNQTKIGHVYYNIGSAYLFIQDFTKAIHNLGKSYEIYKDDKEDKNTYILLLQKLFLAHMGIEQRREAEVYLNLSIDFYSTIEEKEIIPSLRASLDWMKTMFGKENYLEEEDYLNAVKALYDNSLKDSHRGFQNLYGSYLIDAYKAQRKYKDALRITEDLFVKTPFS